MLGDDLLLTCRTAPHLVCRRCEAVQQHWSSKSAKKGFAAPPGRKDVPHVQSKERRILGGDHAKGCSIKDRVHISQRTL